MYVSSYFISWNQNEKSIVLICFSSQMLCCAKWRAKSDWMWTVKRWPYVQNLVCPSLSCGTHTGNPVNLSSLCRLLRSNAHDTTWFPSIFAFLLPNFRGRQWTCRCLCLHEVLAVFGYFRMSLRVCGICLLCSFFNRFDEGGAWTSTTTQFRLCN